MLIIMTAIATLTLREIIKGYLKLSIVEVGPVTV
jgi:hypothetical protein